MSKVCVNTHCSSDQLVYDEEHQRPYCKKCGAQQPKEAIVDEYQSIDRQIGGTIGWDTKNPKASLMAGVSLNQKMVNTLEKQMKRPEERIRTEVYKRNLLTVMDSHFNVANKVVYNSETHENVIMFMKTFIAGKRKISKTNFEHLFSVCAFIVLRKAQASIQLTEICQAVFPNDHSRQYKKCCHVYSKVQKYNIDPESDAPKIEVDSYNIESSIRRFVTLPYDKWHDFFAKWLDPKDIDKARNRIYQKALQIYKTVGKNSEFIVGKKPSVIAACALSCAATSLGLKLKQKDLTAHFNVSDFSVRQNSRLLSSLLERADLP